MARRGLQSGAPEVAIAIDGRAYHCAEELGFSKAALRVTFPSCGSGPVSLLIAWERTTGCLRHIGRQFP